MCGITGRIDTPDIPTVQVHRIVLDGYLHRDPGPVGTHRRIDDTAG